MHVAEKNEGANGVFKDGVFKIERLSPGAI
jgi:hypothetical protein